MHHRLIRSAAVGATALAVAGLAGGVAAGATSATQTTVFHAQLKQSGGAASKPASSGAFVGRLSGKTMHYSITYKGVKGTLHSASIQVGKSGSKSALTVPLTGKLSASPLTGTITPSAALLTAMRHGTATVWLKASNPTSALSGAAKA